MKKVLTRSLCGIIFLLVFVSGDLLAQVSYIKGEKLKLPKDGMNYYYVFSKDRSSYGYFVYSRKEKGIKFFQFDKTLKVQDELTFELPNIPKNAMDETIITTSGKKTFWLYAAWDKPTESEKLYLHEFEFENKKLSPEPRLILESSKLTGDLVNLGGYNIQVANKYKYFHSTDTSKQLITYQLAPTEKNDRLSYAIYGIHVFDKNFTKLWSKEFKMPYTESQAEVVDYEVTNKGDVHVLVKLKKEKVKGQKGKQPPTFEVFKYTAKDNNPKITKFDGEGYYFNDIYMYETPTGEMAFLGHYGKSKDVYSIAGLFTYTWDEKKSSFKKNLYEMPNDLVLRYSRKFKKADGDNDYDATDLEITDVIPTKGGGFYIISEVRYWEIVSGSNSTYTRYYYDDVFISKVAKDGKLEWMNKIPKRQSTNVLPIGGVSYTAYEVDNTLHLYYADNLKNLELEEDKTPQRHIDGAGGMLIDASFNPKTGAMDRKVLFNYREEKIPFLNIRYFSPFQKYTLVGSYGNGAKRTPFVFSIK